MLRESISLMIYVKQEKLGDLILLKERRDIAPARAAPGQFHPGAATPELRGPGARLVSL